LPPALFCCRRTGLSLEPDLQYVVNPGGDLSVPNAVVVGVRIRLDLFGS